MDAEGDGGTVGLLAVDALDVDDPLLAVNLGDLALSALGRATDDQDLVVLADGERADLYGCKAIGRGAKWWSESCCNTTQSCAVKARNQSSMPSVVICNGAMSSKQNVIDLRGRRCRRFLS